MGRKSTAKKMKNAAWTNTKPANRAKRKILNTTGTVTVGHVRDGNSNAREMEAKQEGITRTKVFRYPPILPVVYYEGSENWTADMNFRDRLRLQTSEDLEKFLKVEQETVKRIVEKASPQILEIFAETICYWSRSEQ